MSDHKSCADGRQMVGSFTAGLFLGFATIIAVYAMTHTPAATDAERREVHTDTVRIIVNQPTETGVHPAGRSVTARGAIVHPDGSANAPSDGKTHATFSTPVTGPHSSGSTPSPSPINAFHPTAEPERSADSATVRLEAQQRVYSDTLYTAYVSGIDPRLDSIRLFLPIRHEVITVRKPDPRLSVGFTAGAGYGLFGRRPDVFIGLAVTYNLTPRK